MDIRKYFTPKPSLSHNTRKQGAIIQSQESNGKKARKKSSTKEETAKKSEKRKRVAYISESSNEEDVTIVEESPTPKKKSKSEGPAGVRSSPRTASKAAKKLEKPENRIKSSAADFFGTKKVTSGSKEAPKSIASKLAEESKKKDAVKGTSSSKVKAEVSKDEIVVLGSDEDWSDDESFVQLIDDKSEEHKDKLFNEALDQLDKSKTSTSPSKNRSGSSKTKSKQDVTQLLKATPEKVSKRTPSKRTPIKDTSTTDNSTPKKTPSKNAVDDKVKTATKKSPSKVAEDSKPKVSTEKTPSKTPVKSKEKTPKSPSKTPTKSKRSSKYKPLPIDDGTKKSKHDSPKATDDDTPVKKSRRIQEETPDSAMKSSKPETPKKSRKVNLGGKTFVITGQLESMERDEAKEVIVKHGGRVVSALSGKVNYLVAGEDAGVAKMAKAEKMKGLKIIYEPELQELLGMSADHVIAEQMNTSMAMEEEEVLTQIKKAASPVKKPLATTLPVKKPLATTSQKSEETQVFAVKQPRDSAQDLLWVEKYKPNSVNKIIGQTGDKSNAKKLLTWLNNWHRHRKLGTKPVSSFGGFGRGDPTGAGFRAALLSGPPGIGKTTSAVLVCKEAGFSFFEMNASDSRNKRILQDTVGQALGNTTLVDYMSGRSQSETNSKKHCIIMDEVDGMAGNEDRGGVQEMIQLIKGSHIPVICICNDRQSQKIRSLANHCFDLRFQRPRVEQIKAAMKSVCFKEGINIDSDSLNGIIESSNHDVRQILHNLSVWSASSKQLDRDQMKEDSNRAKKDFKIDAFTACRMAFSESETSKMSLKDKSDLFFYDYSIHPLFVQENYIHAVPHASRGNDADKLKRLARAANSIAMGDVINKAIRTDKWGLLPMQAMFSSVLPAESVMGHLSKQIDFPKWLGKYSTTNKNFRLNREISMHIGLNVTANARHVCLDYLPILRDRLTIPLIKEEQSEGVRKVVGLMEDYDLLKDDYDSILELTQWSNQRDLRTLIESKTKAALTRQYNKSSHKLHYSVAAAPIKKKRGQAAVDPEDEAVDESEGDSDEEVVNALKVQPKKTSAKAQTSKGKAAPSKEKKPRAPRSGKRK